MPYTAEKPSRAASSDELRARIPGWGVDLDPADRPSSHRLRYDPGATGAHWDVPERQVEEWPRERSIEHAHLTPVFGTSCPPEGASGAIRRYSYERFSEGRAAHWLLLLAADRVDVVEHRIRAIRSGRPDPVTETGLRSELTHHGLRSRFRQGRADVTHQWMDPFVASAAGVIGVVAATRLVRRVGRLLRLR